MPSRWELRDIQHAEEVCKALARIPVIKQAQIAKLVGIHPMQVSRLVQHAYDKLVKRPYVSQKHRSNRYHGGQGLRYYVRMTPEATEEWGKREGITPRVTVRSDDLLRYLATMDVLVALRTQNLLYDEWDIRLPQNEEGAFHAILGYRDSDYRLGLYLLPHKYVDTHKRKKLAVIRGIVRQVDQKAVADGVVYLIPRAYYAEALRLFVKLALATRSTYLIPLESFMEKPRYFLWAIRLGEQWYIDELLQALSPSELLPKPLQYDYAVLAKMDDRTYRLIDSYVSGDIGRLRSWLYVSPPTGFQVPGTGSVAAATVYVFDDTMYRALTGLIQQGHGNAITEFLPWIHDFDDEKDVTETDILV